MLLKIKEMGNIYSNERLTKEVKRLQKCICAGETPTTEGTPTIRGIVPPTNTSYFWHNDTFALDYVYNDFIGAWTSKQNFVQNYSARNNVNNNAFLRIDNVRLASDRGIITPYDSVLAFITWTQDINVSGNIAVYSNNSLIGTIAVSGTISGALIPGFPVVDDFENISLQWNGTQTQNLIIYLSYKSIYIP